MRQLNIAIYADELGDLTPSYLALRPRFIRSVLTERKQWCDNVTTPEKETCGDILRLSLERALGDLRQRHGDTLQGWQWGSEHKAKFRHPVLGQIPVLRNFTDLEIESGGGHTTINRGAMHVGNADDPFANIHGPGYRAIYDLKNLDQSRFMIATGQSGHPLSENYGNLLRPWKDGRYLRISAKRMELMNENATVMTLTPETP